MAKPKNKNFNPKFKGNKPGKKPDHYDGQFESRDSSGRDKAAYNDAIWYKHVAGTTAPLVKLPFFRPNGYGITGHGPKKFKVSNVVLNFIPSFGTTKDAQSNINLVSQQVYSFVRHQNSGSKNYDAPDLTQMIMGVSNVYLLLEDYIAAFGLLNQFSVTNKTLPISLIQDKGYDYFDLVKHQNDLESFINTAIYQISSFALPGEMSIFHRWSFILSNVFGDDYISSLNNQFYVYKLRGVYLYDWANVRCKFYLRNNHGTLMTYDDIVNEFNMAMSLIMGNEDVGIMSGDIIKAFGDKLMRLNPIPNDYKTPITRVTNEVLNQIRNAKTTAFDNVTACLRLDDDTNHDWLNKFLATYDIKQDTTGKYLVCDPEVPIVAEPTPVFSTSTYGTGMTNRISYLNAEYPSGFKLNFETETPTEDEILVATRLTWAATGNTTKFGQTDFKKVVGSTTYVNTGLPISIGGSEIGRTGWVFAYGYQCGSEMITGISLNTWGVDTVTPGLMTLLASTQYCTFNYLGDLVYNAGSNTLKYDGAEFMAKIAQSLIELRGAPSCLAYSNASGGNRVTADIGTIVHEIPVDFQLLGNYHLLALYSELFVPSIGYTAA